jgi:hypothetical protein
MAMLNNQMVGFPDIPEMWILLVGFLNFLGLPDEVGLAYEEADWDCIPT